MGKESACYVRETASYQLGCHVPVSHRRKEPCAHLDLCANHPVEIVQYEHARRVPPGLVEPILDPPLERWQTRISVLSAVDVDGVCHANARAIDRQHGKHSTKRRRMQGDSEDARLSTRSSALMRRAASLTSAVFPAPLAPVMSTPGIAPALLAAARLQSVRAESECTMCEVRAVSGRSMPARVSNWGEEAEGVPFVVGEREEEASPLARCEREGGGSF